MSKGNTFENDLLKLIFNGTAIANLADNAASSPLTSLYGSLHATDPGEAGDQTTGEVSYTGYARQAIARTTGGFTVSANVVSLAAAVNFPVGSAGAQTTAFYFAFGTAVSGAGKILYSGPIGTNLGPFTTTTADTFTLPGLSGLAVDDRIAFFAVPGSTLPTGVTEGTVYWVKTVSGDAVTVSATQGGATLDVTAVGDGIAYKMLGVVTGLGFVPQLTTATTVTED